MISVFELIMHRRTIRRFNQDKISKKILNQMVTAAHVAPSGANLQPCEFIIVDEPAMVNHMFQQTRWAGYLPPEQGPPPPGQRPVAYIIVLLNREVCPKTGQHDAAAAIMNMIYTALENGIGSCWIGAIDRDSVRANLQIPARYDIDSILALGYPAEEPVMEPLKDTVQYYRDETGRLHVPKRRLEEVLHWNMFQAPGQGDDQVKTGLR